MLNQDHPQRPRLLLLLAPADHPHRDAVCSTLAWLARDEGVLFECYLAGQASGAHFGGNHPAFVPLADLRGGTVVGGHHLEQLATVLLRFSCQVATLGQGPFDQYLRDTGVAIRAASANVTDFYREVFAGGNAPMPRELIVVGDGGRPQEVSLSPYAMPEILERRALAIADGDPEALESLAEGRTVVALWCSPSVAHEVIEVPPDRTVSVQTAWMSERHAATRRGFLLADPELAARWIPTAARNGWTPVFGIPQADVIDRLSPALEQQDVVFGRQQDDRDFLHLSKLGVAFQLIDPGRPAYPVIREAAVTWPRRPERDDSPPDAQLEAWAREGRVLSSLLFWTGMARELENLYALSDVIALSGLRCGLILTTESFANLSGSPLSMLNVPREDGGLFPLVEPLIASAGVGAVLESIAPRERFAKQLDNAMGQLRRVLGDDVPRGWWPVLDCELVPKRTSRVAARSSAPFVRIRYERARLGESKGAVSATSSMRGRIRAAVRTSPARHLFEAARPFDRYRPGAPTRSVLAAVRDAGFTYALTKSDGGRPPTTVSGIDGLTVINHTVGRWGGWTPFVTVDGIDDLKRAERALLARRKPGWLIGTLDACLWAFTGPVWQRGRELREMCDLMATGGVNGRLVNVTPETVARYARVLELSQQIPSANTM